MKKPDDMNTSRHRPLTGMVAVAALFCGTVSYSAETLPIGTPEEHGVRSDVLREMSEWVRSEELDVRSMLLLRHGERVLEWYAGGVSREHNHNIYSITKSVVGTLAGIAVDAEKLSGTDVPLQNLFPQSRALLNDPRKARVTLGDLLTMRSGFQCARSNQPTGPEKTLFDRIHRAENRTEFILQLAMLRAPGATFAYGNAEPQIVVSIIQQAYGKEALPLAEKLLFNPLDFRNVQWLFPDKTGTVPGGYGLRLRAIDMAKLGQLYLQQGEWHGTQVVSSDWIRQATTDQTGTGYGYYWWIDPAGSFAAKGVRGQQIFVDRDRQTVFVVTADLPPERVQGILKKLTGTFIQKAVTAEDRLPAAPELLAGLNKELKQAAGYVPGHRQGLVPARLPQR